MAGNTGPTSPDGKTTSARNATKHNMCAQQVLVRGERQEDFDAHREEWFQNYDASEPGARPLIEQAALAEWLLKRTQRAYLQMDTQLFDKDCTAWTAEDWKNSALAQRYKTAQERSFARAQAAVERFRRARVIERQVERRLDIAEKAAEMNRTLKKPKVLAAEQAMEEAAKPNLRKQAAYLADVWEKPPVIPAITQHVYVKVVDGVTVTRVRPSNAELAQEAAMRIPERQPIRVFRELVCEKKDWLPAEYTWIDRLPGQMTWRRQEMSWVRWQHEAEREATAEGGHVGPVDDGWEQDEAEYEKWARAQGLAARQRVTTVRDATVLSNAGLIINPWSGRDSCELRRPRRERVLRQADSV